MPCVAVCAVVSCGVQCLVAWLAVLLLGRGCVPGALSPCSWGKLEEPLQRFAFPESAEEACRRSGPKHGRWGVGLWTGAGRGTGAHVRHPGVCNSQSNAYRLPSGKSTRKGVPLGHGPACCGADPLLLPQRAQRLQHGVRNVALRTRLVPDTEAERGWLSVVTQVMTAR